MAEVGRYEIRNYGPTTGVIYNRVMVKFWAGSNPQYTNDPVLAKLAGGLKYVDVIDTKPEPTLEEMTAKELQKKAKDLGISGMSRKPKITIIETIELAELEGVSPASMEE